MKSLHVQCFRDSTNTTRSLRLYDNSTCMTSTKCLTCNKVSWSATQSMRYGSLAILIFNVVGPTCWCSFLVNEAVTVMKNLRISVWLPSSKISRRSESIKRLSAQTWRICIKITKSCGKKRYRHVKSISDIKKWWPRSFSFWPLCSLMTAIITSWAWVSKNLFYRRKARSVARCRMINRGAAIRQQQQQRRQLWCMILQVCCYTVIPLKSPNFLPVRRTKSGSVVLLGGNSCCSLTAAILYDKISFWRR